MVKGWFTVPLSICKIVKKKLQGKGGRGGLVVKLRTR